MHLELEIIWNKWPMVNWKQIHLFLEENEKIATILFDNSNNVIQLENLYVLDKNNFDKWYWRVLIIAFLKYLEYIKEEFERIEWWVEGNDLPLWYIWGKLWFTFEEDEYFLDCDFYLEKKNIQTVIKNLLEKNKIEMNFDLIKN